MIINYNELSDLRREASGTIALRFGSYDILHAGHQAGIDFAARQAGIVVIGVMPDEYIRRIKGPGRPHNSQAARLEAINQAPNVDYSTVVPPNKLALAGLFLKLRPDVYVEENMHKSRMKAAFMGMLGIDYVIDSDSRLHSTSAMIRELGVEGALLSSSLTYRPERPQPLGQL